VHWSPRETTTLLLGDTPIVVGGGPQAHVRTSFQKDAPPVAATFRFADGAVALERTGGARRALRDGEFVEFGAIRVQVRVAATDDKTGNEQDRKPDGKGDGVRGSGGGGAPRAREAEPPRARVPEPKTRVREPEPKFPSWHAGAGNER